MYQWKVWLLFLPVAWLLAFTPAEASAQEVKGDSATLSAGAVADEEPHSLFLPVQPITPQPSVPSGRDSLVTLDAQHLLHPNLLYLPFTLNPTPLFRGDFATSGALYRYRMGQIWLEGEQNSLPGIGRINEVSAVWSHQLNDRLTLHAAVIATQLNMEFFHRHVLELNGRLNYRLNDHLTLHLFGSYDTGNPYNPYGRQWGGSLDWQMSPRFGIEGGVRRSYDAVTGRWETVPIVAPYYNFNGKFRLQIDTGPLIQQLLRGAIYGHEGRGNPTIAPPKNSLAPR